MNDSAFQFRVALRSLRRSPVFALSSVAILAIGIAAVGAVFSVVDAVLLRPLPYRQPADLVSVWETGAPGSGSAGRVDGASFSAWRGATGVFARLAAFSAFGGTLTEAGDPRLLRGSQVTADYFETLGVSPLVGRFFAAGEDATSSRVVVLGHGLWLERFGGARDVVGRTLTLDDAPYVIVGVAPDGLYPSWPINEPRMHFRRAYQDFWVPLPSARLADRRSHVLGVIGRLAPDATPMAAEAALAQLADGSSSASFAGALVRPLVEEAVGDVRPALRLLLGAAALVLLAACANVGGLIVARAVERRHELALRRALGAGLRALVRRQLAEALILASAAAATGAVLAATVLPILSSWVPRDVPRLEQATIDSRALAVAVAAALFASLSFALLPLGLARRARPADALREGGRGGDATAGRQRLSQLLVSAQIALAVALAITATLLVESFRRLESTPLGISTEHVLVADLQLPSRRYDRPAMLEPFYRQLLARISIRPEVLAAHLAYDHPLEANWLDSFALEGREPRDETPWTAELRFVTPGLFEDLGVPVLAGREFEAGDRSASRPVAVVNRAFARRFFGGDNAVGAALQTAVATYTWGESAPTRFEIIGVVGDVATPGLERTEQPCFYLDVWQVPMPELKLLVRTSGDPELVVPAIRAAVHELDRDQPLGSVRTLEDERRRAVAQPRFSMRLMSIFGATALALASVGVYGLLAGWVAGRRREIGVRAALGAGRPAQLALVLRRGLRLAAAGVAGGMLAALALGRLLHGQLYGVAATDLEAFLLAPMLVLAAALLACIVPAVEATRVDPAQVLRQG